MKKQQGNQKENSSLQKDPLPSSPHHKKKKKKMGNAASTPNPPLLSALLLDPSPLIGGHIKTSTYQGEEEEGRGQGEEEGGGGGGGGLNVDFVGVEENGGWAWVADTVGHSWPEHKRPLAQKIEKHWEEGEGERGGEGGEGEGEGEKKRGGKKEKRRW